MPGRTYTYRPRRRTTRAPARRPTRTRYAPRRTYAPRSIPRSVANKTTSMVGFPKTRLVEMRFSQNYVMNSLPDPSGTDENFIYANSLYRPDNSDGTVRNALGYAQWGTFYHKYTILKAHIKVQFTSAQNAPVGGIWDPLVVGVQLTNDQDPIASVATLIEQRAARTALMQSPANGNMVTLSANYYAAAWHGVKDVQDVEGLYANFVMSQIEADDTATRFHPFDRSFFRVFYQAPSAGADAVEIQAQCLVTYTVLCQDPRNLTSVAPFVPTGEVQPLVADEAPVFIQQHFPEEKGEAPPSPAQSVRSTRTLNRVVRKH